MAAITIVDAKEIAEAERWDAESYDPDLRRLEQAVGGSRAQLGSVASVLHPTEIPRVYTGDETGVPFLLAANIRPILPNFASLSRIPGDVAKRLPVNRLDYDDCLVTRTGANHGVACVFLEESGKVYTSGEGLIVRPLNIAKEEPGIDGAYLGAFLGCRYGLRLCQKAVYGSGQPHISQSYLRKIPVLRLGDTEQEIGRLVRDAWDNGRNALPIYAQAQAKMLDSIGLAGLQQRSSLSNVEHFRAVESAGRYDASFFSARAKSLVRFLGKDKRSISDVADIANRPFIPNPQETFSYIEITDVDKIGRVGASTVPGEEAPDRAKWLVKPGDVLTSTVRPIRRLTGVVAKEQDGFVCSSGFSILCPKNVEPEVLLVYLRLPPVCELLDIYARGSMYPAFLEVDLRNIPVLLPPKGIRDRIVAKVRAAWQAQADADAKLREAREAVERVIAKRLG